MGAGHLDAAPALACLGDGAAHHPYETRQLREAGAGRCGRASSRAPLRAPSSHGANSASLLLANSGVTDEPPEVAAAASRRLVAYLLQSLRAEGATPLPPPAPLELDRAAASPRHR